MTKEQLQELVRIRQTVRPPPWDYIPQGAFTTLAEEKFSLALVNSFDDIVAAIKQRDHHKQTLAKIAELLCDLSDEGHDAAEALAVNEGKR